MPRHPPCALHSLSQQRQNNTHQPTPQSRDEPATQLTSTPPSQREGVLKQLQRCSRPLCRSQTTTPPTPTPPNRERHRQREDQKQPTRTTPPAKTTGATRGNQAHGPIPAADPSGPNSVLNQPPANAGQLTHPPPAQQAAPTRERVVDVPLVRHHHAPDDIRTWSGCVLLRKEVIQPHLPVRLPCYDFVPIASPTFDGSFHKG